MKIFSCLRSNAMLRWVPILPPYGHPSKDMTSYLQAESLENWRSNALATMHIEPTKVERKYVSYDPVPLLRLEGQLIS